MNSDQVTEAVPVASLSEWIRSNVSNSSGPITVSHLSGGSSNLTFRVQDDANDWVLRRPPVGAFLATANDIGREYLSIVMDKPARDQVICRRDVVETG